MRGDNDVLSAGSGEHFQSAALAVPFEVRKYKVPLTFVKKPGAASELTSAVPSALPSLFHNPATWEASDPAKYKVSLATTRWPGVAAELTRTVPASVPSLFHILRPWTPSSAVKNNSPLRFVSSIGLELFG